MHRSRPWSPFPSSGESGTNRCAGKRTRAEQIEKIERVRAPRVLKCCLLGGGPMVRIRLPPQPPGFATPAAWADKPVRPARRYQISSAGRLIAEALLELNQGARKIGHRGHRGQLSS